MSDKTRNQNIFGTPPEPYFSHEVTGLTKEILMKWLSGLNEENEKMIACVTEYTGVFKYGEFAEFVFLTCEKFKLPDEVRYLALELFDSFMVKHIEELYKHILTSEKYTKKNEWLAVQERIRNQVILRIASCCQIASKLTSHYKVIINSKIRNLLAEFGHNYSKESILQSEIRVLKTLHYELSISSPIIYLEIILELLGLDDPALEIKVLYVICVKVLDLVYLEHKTAYNKLYCSLTGQQNFTASEGGKFSAVENNKIFLAVSIIATGAYIMDQKTTNKIIDSLCALTSIPLEDIVDFAAVLIQMIANAKAN